MEQLANGGFAPPGLPAEAIGADASGVLDEALVRDSAGQVEAHYQYLPRPVGRLAVGELVHEPVLGLVRVTDIRPFDTAGKESTHVQIVWRDDHEPSRAAVRYRLDRSLPARTPAPGDQLRIRQGIDQATWRRREISGGIARLIAAHLHAGPNSALYAFAVNGQVFADLYDELDYAEVSRAAYRPWVSALTRYALSRQDTGPVPGWGPQPGPPDCEPRTPPANARGRTVPSRSRRPPNTRRLSAETAQRLIDEAFALGVTAGRLAFPTANVRHLIKQYTLSESG